MYGRTSMWERLGVIGAISVIALFLAAIIGWAMNLYQLALAAAHFDPNGNWAMLLLRAVGVFVFPVGGVAGYF